jgi:hypothetical protein
MKMDFTNERRLVFTISDKWAGWFCERCCWNVPAPGLLSERDKIARDVADQFTGHDCDTFARQNWRTNT